MGSAKRIRFERITLLTSRESIDGKVETEVMVQR